MSPCGTDGRQTREDNATQPLNAGRLSFAITIFSAIEALSDEDRVLDYGGLGNFSLSGFEMVLTTTTHQLNIYKNISVTFDQN